MRAPSSSYAKLAEGSCAWACDASVHAQDSKLALGELGAMSRGRAILEGSADAVAGRCAEADWAIDDGWEVVRELDCKLGRGPVPAAAIGGDERFYGSKSPPDRVQCRVKDAWTRSGTTHPPQTPLIAPREENASRA